MLQTISRKIINFYHTGSIKYDSLCCNQLEYTGIDMTYNEQWQRERTMHGVL